MSTRQKVQSRYKKPVKGKIKYLVCQKRFIVENDIWEKEEDLENTKKVVVEEEGI